MTTLKEMLTETVQLNEGPGDIDRSFHEHAKKMHDQLDSAHHYDKALAPHHFDEHSHYVEHHSMHDGLHTTHEMDIGTQSSDVHKALTAAGMQHSKSTGKRYGSSPTDRNSDKHYAGVHNGHHVTARVSHHEADYMSDDADIHAQHKVDPYVGAVHIKIHPK